ncbi:carboxymuconolactone decarboxylase family protein [Pelagerythrobacter sp.]|uniref:carboxymuconolactone decarboxylase family protein n=1 Tax=Pelagerythrobacter sp. TaxID=2800702 RepID=UPI0035AE2505
MEAAMSPDTLFERVNREAMSDRHKASWDRSKELHGDTTFVEVLANAPDAYDWYNDAFYRDLFYSGRVDRKLVELVRLYLAGRHGCASCNRSDWAAALAAGYTEEQLDSLHDPENGPFEEREKAILALASVMSLANAADVVEPDLHARLRTSFSTGELVEFGMIMAILTGMAKFILAFDLLERLKSCPFTTPGRK